MGRRRWQGRADGRGQRGQRRGPLGAAAVRASALASCSAAVSVAGGPQGCVCAPVCPGRGPGPRGRGSAERPWVGAPLLSEAVAAPVHVRRVRARGSSGGILRAVALT